MNSSPSVAARLCPETRQDIAILALRISQPSGVLSVFGDRQIGAKRQADLVSVSTIQDEAFPQEFEPSPPKHLSLEHL
ncbi:MAG: hypothetical protein AAGA40_09105 [Cyanobacteria bacterium P01_E01_bin.45]